MLLRKDYTVSLLRLRHRYDNDQVTQSNRITSAMLLCMHKHTSVADLHVEQLVGTEELLPAIVPACLRHDSTSMSRSAYDMMILMN
jgi:hypothetical protein